MSASNWSEWAEPDLSHAAELPDVALAYDGGRRRSIIPDPLAIAIAAESGRPILVPLFPVAGFSPQSPCPHHGPIRDGSPQTCMICHASGMDDHPAVRRTAADEIPPEPRPSGPEKSASPVPPAALTRKQRRAQQLRGAAADV